MNIGKVKSALDKYLIACEKGLRGTLPSGANMEATRTQKPGSRSPQNAYGEKFISDAKNSEARMKFEPALRYLKNEHPALFATLADEVASPGLKNHMETVNGQGKHGYVKPSEPIVHKDKPLSEHRRAEFDYQQALRAHEHRKAEWKRLKAKAPEWLDASERAREEVAAFVVRWFDEEPHVNLDPADLPLKFGTEPALKRSHDQDRVIDARSKYEKILERLEEIESERPDAYRKDCIAVLCEERKKQGKKDHSEALVRKAIRVMGHVRDTERAERHYPRSA